MKLQQALQNTKKTSLMAGLFVCLKPSRTRLDSRRMRAGVA